MELLERLKADLEKVVYADHPVADTHGIAAAISAVVEAAYRAGRADADESADFLTNEANERGAA